MATTTVPSVEYVTRIAASENPVLRNLAITDCYSRLAAAFAERVGEGANWCAYATWASRQAGRSIRGEDMQDVLDRVLGESRWLLHPFATVWRRLLRRGLFQPATRLGRLTAALHTPFDAFERASDAVARGNLKVFAEIGLEFARCLGASDGPTFLGALRPGDPPDGQRYLRQAFARYERARTEQDAGRRTQWIVLANLEVGFHEQTRLQPEIREALDAAEATGADLERRAVDAVFPGLRAIFRRPLGAAVRRLQRQSSTIAREVITETLMVLALPGRVLILSANMLDEIPLRCASRPIPICVTCSRCTSRSRRRSTTAAPATGRISTSACTTSSISSAPSTNGRSSSTSPSRPLRVRRSPAVSCPRASSDRVAPAPRPRCGEAGVPGRRAGDRVSLRAPLTAGAAEVRSGPPPRQPASSRPGLQWTRARAAGGSPAARGGLARLRLGGRRTGAVSGARRAEVRSRAEREHQRPRADQGGRQDGLDAADQRRRAAEGAGGLVPLPRVACSDRPGRRDDHRSRPCRLRPLPRLRHARRLEPGGKEMAARRHQVEPRLQPDGARLARPEGDPRADRTRDGRPRQRGRRTRHVVSRHARALEDRRVGADEEPAREPPVRGLVAAARNRTASRRRRRETA